MRTSTRDSAVQRDPDDRDVALVRTIHDELARRTGLAFPARLWDGTEVGDAGEGFRVVLEHPWSLRLLLRAPFDLAAGEAYVEGAIDLEGDPMAAMRFGSRLDRAGVGPQDLARLAALTRRLPRPPRQPHHRRARLRGRMHTKARDRRTIAFHYNLSQAFYEAFLLDPGRDRHLVYSCAVFAEEAEPLEDAQRRKLDLVCRKLRLRPGARLLDIGCGWGTLLAHAAQHYGTTGVGVTLSETQAEAGRELVARLGLSDRVDIRLQDYRDLADGVERFDAVASVGMAEHVGPSHLGEYIAAVRRLLDDGGLFLNHSMLMGDPDRIRTGRERTFANAYVFPDGGLVPLWRMVREIERGGFEVVDVEQLRPHYALTLRRWVANLDAARDRAVAAASETDYRIWRVYMAGSAVGFENGTFAVAQVLGRTRGEAGPALPLGRAWMMPG